MTKVIDYTSVYLRILKSLLTMKMDAPEITKNHDYFYLLLIEINTNERFQKCKQIFQIILLCEENKLVCLAKFENSKPSENWGRKAKGLK